MLWVISASPLFSAAQSCSGTIRTSTVSTNFGGTGSNTYVSSLPQFTDTFSKGYTLIAAVVSSYATTSTTLGLQNTSSSEQMFFPAISRTDVIKMNGSTLTAGNSSYNYDFTDLDVVGTPDDHTSYGPLNVFNNTRIAYDSVNTSSGLLNSFKGTGNLSFSYKSTSSLTVPLGVSASAAVNDNITLSITYYYCDPTVLASNIVAFSASRAGAQRIVLNWTISNEHTGRKYEVEVSKDGRLYETASSRYSDAVNGEAQYSDSYAIEADASGKLWFRLKQTEIGGAVSWSPLRMIDLDAGGGPGGFSIYPNPPTDFINVQFPPGGLRWQVDILAADGRLMMRNAYQGLTEGRVNFIRRLAPGTYFARATELQTGKHFAAAFMIK